jgi:hypothetical protein
MSTASANGGGPFGRFSVQKNRTMPSAGGWLGPAYFWHANIPGPALLDQPQKDQDQAAGGLVVWGFLPAALTGWQRSPDWADGAETQLLLDSVLLLPFLASCTAEAKEKKWLAE